MFNICIIGMITIPYVLYANLLFDIANNENIETVYSFVKVLTQIGRSVNGGTKVSRNLQIKY